MKIASLSLISVLLIGCSNEVDEPVNDEEITETEEVHEDSKDLELKEKSTFITEAFATLLDYNNETYDDRSNALQNYFTVEAIQQAVGYEHIDTEVSFESTNSNNQIFKSLGNETNEYILITDVVFEVEDVVTTNITNIYEFELVENEGQYRIDNLRSTPKQQNLQ
jgi:PBP1b-binding outer membrane lipoprotein LpoB